jgi:hypothetical protein
MNSERNIIEELDKSETGESVQSENSDQGKEAESNPNAHQPVMEKGGSENSKKDDTAPELDNQVNSDERPEEDHEEHDEYAHDDHESESINYSKLTKPEILQLLEDLEKSPDLMAADKVANFLKSRMGDIIDRERSDALEKFIDEEGSESEFEFPQDKVSIKFEATYRLLKDRKRKYLRELDQVKEKNHEKAIQTLEKLRQFVDSDESSSSFSAFKDIQKVWKEIGPLPKGQVKNLWANYNALVNLFYDKRSIYFELKELDRKKNLEAKLELCQKATQLAKDGNLKKAIIELNDLHNEFKHIGPVPPEEQESLWKRFKSASDEIYARRKEHYQQFKAVQKDNLVKKDQLIEKMKSFTEFSSELIKDWNHKTKEIQQIQKEWEATGGVPRENSKDINKHFWSHFKEFFKNKNRFFKELEDKREENLKAKEDLVGKVQELISSKDLEKTADQIKSFQKKWKEVGPVPEKKRQQVFDKFKAACDEFFDKRRSSHKEALKQYEANLERKKEIISEIKRMAAEKSSDLTKLDQLKQEFDQIGFVPRNAINSTKSEFSKAVENFIRNANIEDDKKEEILIEAEFSQIKNDPQSVRKLHQKEQSLRRQIYQVENDINLMKTNMEYFAESRNARLLKDQFNEKITTATDELTRLKKQLRILRS